MIEQQLKESLAYVLKRSTVKPRLGFVLGSGLSAFAHTLEAGATDLTFAEIPHFATASVEGHPGRLRLGQIGGVPVAIMQGRLHAYEGLSLQQVIYPVRLMKAMGVDTLVVTNAAGGLRRTMRPGDFMIIRDHINLTGENPLRGANYSAGPRFVDMTTPYDKVLGDVLAACLKKERVKVHNGVYIGVMGPSYETAAEIRFYGRIGGGAVGMSTVAEVIAARHVGLRVVGLSCITNLGTGLSKTKLSHAEVKDVAAQVEVKFTKALNAFVRKAKSHL